MYNNIAQDKNTERQYTMLPYIIIFHLIPSVQSIRGIWKSNMAFPSQNIRDYDDKSMIPLSVLTI